MVDTRNQADQLIYQTEKSLKEQGDKIDSEDKNKVEAAIGRLTEAVKTDNVEEMKSAIEGLNNVWGEIASKLYAQAQTQPGPEAQPGPGAQAQEPGPEAESGKKVEDADFEVIDDKDK